jgi:IS4 transposase
LYSERFSASRTPHLIKTFLPGWTDRQSADGTVVITTPTGHTYTTKTEPAEHRGLMMPKRKRTRSQTRAQRIKAERAPPPF